jgi:hypothetical protein
MALPTRRRQKEVKMSEKSKKDLREAMQGAEISDVDLETVAGGDCNESCYSSCSQCCKDGSANRGGGGDLEPLHPDAG